MTTSDTTRRRARLPVISALTALMVAIAACETTPAQRSGDARAATPAKRPNVIVIIADDLGFADISANGGPIQTPNIDALARSGARMTSGYATAAVCAPSRAGLLAGRQQTRFGFEFNPVGRDEQSGMALGEVTIAQTMKAAGYRTGMVGKWHIGQAAGYTPLDRGFDSYYGILGGATPYLTTIGANDLHVVTGEDRLITRARLPVFDGRTRVNPEGYLTDVLTDKAVEFVSAGSEQPFFLYLAYNAPHTPLQAPEKYLARVGAQPSDYHRVYRAMMLGLDDGVGRLTARLKELGIYDDTLIIFLSDNGCPNYIGEACSNAPLKASKGYPWDGGVKVPYLISWPRHIRPTVDARPVSSLDIAATAAAAAGVIHPKAEGIDLVRLLSEPAKPTGRTLFWRMGPTKIVRDEHWKLLVINKGAPPQATPDGAPSDDLGKSLRPDGMTASVSELGQWTLLYDMRTDPGETRNVAELHPEVVRDLLARWDAWNTGNVTPQWTSRRGVNAMVDAMRVELFN